MSPEMSKSLKEGLLIALATAILTISGSFIIIRASIINDLRINKADKSELEKKASIIYVDKENNRFKEEIKTVKSDFEKDIDEIKDTQKDMNKKIDRILEKL